MILKEGKKSICLSKQIHKTQSFRVAKSQGKDVWGLLGLHGGRAVPFVQRLDLQGEDLRLRQQGSSPGRQSSLHHRPLKQVRNKI